MIGCRSDLLWQYSPTIVLVVLVLFLSGVSLGAQGASPPRRPHGR